MKTCFQQDLSRVNGKRLNVFDVSLMNITIQLLPPRVETMRPRGVVVAFLTENNYSSLSSFSAVSFPHSSTVSCIIVAPHSKSRTP